MELTIGRLKDISPMRPIGENIRLSLRLKQHIPLRSRHHRFADCISSLAEPEGLLSLHCCHSEIFPEWQLRVDLGPSRSDGTFSHPERPESANSCLSRATNEGQVNIERGHPEAIVGRRGRM